MKIAFFIENYRKGGLDTFLLSLVNNWNDEEDELIIIVNSNHEGLPLLKEKANNKVNFIVYDFFSYKRVRKKFNIKNRLLNYIVSGFSLIFSYPIQIVLLFKLFKSNNIDRILVVNGGYPGGESCFCASVAWFLATGKKAWHNYHNYALPYNKITSPFQYLHDYILSKVVNGFVTVSRSCQKSLKSRKALCKSKSMYIYNGIDFPKSISYSDIREELSLPSTSKLIIILSTFEPRKGHEVLFKAIKNIEMDNVYLLVCGTGTKQETLHLKAIVNKLDINKKVYFLGYRSDSHNLISQSNLLVAPSREFESFGLTLVEAMSLKIPIVCSNVGGMVEVIDDNINGYCIDKDDFLMFSVKIQELLKDNELKSSFIENAYIKFRDKFHVKKMVEQYAKIIKG